MVMCSAFYIDWFVDRLKINFRAQNYGRVLALVLAGCGTLALLHLVVGAARFIFADGKTIGEMKEPKGALQHWNCKTIQGLSF
jgi:hypothetical protein